ncbi:MULTISPECIES: LysR substrate-binding domain-containing protein [Thalassospira]|uniref:HTH lysR-type domain-containing protein n=2 Tax=Thalassospira tepidiphila TaxID=393657 RepID=A0A853KXB8_9PROT|nr:MULTISPECIES: LysR substrate-binding domain-containing protein [Thalassospira]MBE69594.1 LysR family transcriptional regulator [Thalassospira sp.]MBO6578614.1 LysR family transcriptional regulator [Thalassospira sp.]MBO6819784.1 LysR family transcriptional regulator [Thalassospira sp.]MBO6886519.1 LysR family transcriptional regulator [Thalassospira sp.]NJB75893.1 DNA-binding transcriptional LysR family regulator [Thalassospira tepidiphila]|tara:strand:- start:1631 stop:2530 length:900 start_codon:yes stop_codon:yes gene_type:complete
MVHSNDLSLPPLALLPAVMAAARNGSFSAAASEMGVTHSVISRHVAQVEQWLGYDLFERYGRGVRPTPDGQRFLRETQAAIDLLSQGAQPWRQRRGPDVIKISLLPSYARIWFLKLVPEIERDLNVRLELEITERLADFDGGQTDIAIRCGKGQWPGTKSSLLFADDLVPLISPKLLGGLEPQSLDADAIANLPLLNDSDATGWRHWLAEHGVKYRPKPSDRRLEDYSVGLSAADAGLGVILARLPFARTAIGNHDLIMLPFAPVRSPLATFLVQPAYDQRPAVRAVAERLITAAKACD